MSDTAATISDSNLLPAFLNALAELDAAQRAPILRAYLEYGLEIIQANEQEYYTFLSECAMLAADNMQDIRIENIELQLDAMTNPPAKPWGEVFTDVALNLALQVGILIGWEMVAGGVIALAGQKALIAASRAAQAEASAARSQQSEIKGILTRLQAEKDNLLILGGRSAFDAIPNRGGWQIKPSPVETFPSFQAPSIDPGQVSTRYDAVIAELAIAQHATKLNSARVSKALTNYEVALGIGGFNQQSVKRVWGDIWRDNIGNEKGGALISTSIDVIKSLYANKPSASAGGANAPSPNASVAPSLGNEPFLSSEVTGRYLTWTSAERLRVVESYSNMRLLLRATSDSDLIQGDDLIKYIALVSTGMLQRWQELRQSPHYARAAIVKGFEAAFWREYLLARAVLVEPTQENYIAKFPYQAGAVVGGYLIRSTGSEVVYPPEALTPPQTGIPEPAEKPPPLFEHVADFYSGASKLPDLLAGTLFKRFAQAYFSDSNKANTFLPFVFDAAKEPSKYSNVAIPPTDNFWGYPDPEALRRIDEMRYMVIKFFMDIQNVEMDPVLKAQVGSLSFMSEVAGTRAADNLNDCFKAQPVGKVIGGQDDAAANQIATATAENQFKRVAQASGISAANDTSALAIAQLAFAQMLTDTNLDIQAYQLLKNGALEVDQTVDHRTTDQLEEEIRNEQRFLSDQFNELLTLAGDDQKLKADLETIFRPAKDAITQWRPGSTWVWYGLDHSEEEPAP